MKIETSCSPRFGAKYINQVKAGKYISQTKKYSDVQLNFVRIEPDNTQDINALSDAANYWRYDKFAKNIYYAACAVRNKSKYYKNNVIYALTSQTENHSNLNSDKLLGLVHISPSYDSSVLIERIQVNPEMIYCRIPEYKGLGTAMLNSLKNLYDIITCHPATEKSVKDFYYKNDFKPKPNNIDELIWTKQPEAPHLEPIDKFQLLLTSK